MRNSTAVWVKTWRIKLIKTLIKKNLFWNFEIHGPTRPRKMLHDSPMSSSYSSNFNCSNRYLNSNEQLSNKLVLVEPNQVPRIPLSRCKPPEKCCKLAPAQPLMHWILSSPSNFWAKGSCCQINRFGLERFRFFEFRNPFRIVDAIRTETLCLLPPKPVFADQFRQNHKL